MSPAKRTFGKAQKPLAELTDTELEAELQTRRRARGPVGPPPERRTSALDEARRVRQWYANLELPPGASLVEVEAAYRKLLEQFHPDRHAGDPEKHRAATLLVASLTEAHANLITYLARRADQPTTR
ncbi:MAG: DnaJ domain-containing protein [Polyangiales bacterium]|nr:DnaJ domain-containing protein [Myxococcales bacterium]